MRYFIGILLILFGVNLWLQSSGLIADQNIKDSIGSGFVMAIGAALLILKRRLWVWGALIFMVGLTDLVENQQWPMFEKHTPWEYVWPVFVIIIGLHLLLKRNRPVDAKGADAERQT